jgi:hypothetical protein
LDPLHPPQDYPKDSFKYNGFDFTRVPVVGMMASSNMLDACYGAGLKPVCDYPSYNDGKCEKVKTDTW